jgi:hypothetical protein
MAMSATSNVPDLKVEDDDDIDISLIMMNAAAMKMLDAEIDEVAEISHRKSPTSLSTSSSVLDDGEQQEEENEQEEETTKFQFDSRVVEEKRDDLTGDGSSDDDGSFMEELSALKEVAQKIEEELRKETADSMKEAMQRIMHSPAPKNTRTTLESEDREIIDRILDEETKNYVPSNKLENIIWSIRQQGLSTHETTYFLSTLCAFVWAIAFGLMRKVRYAEI